MRRFALALITSQLLTSVSPAFAAAFPVEQASFSLAIQYAESQNILTPLNDGQMHPEQPLTRMDMIAGIVRAVYAKDVTDQCFNNIAPSIPARFTRLFIDVNRDGPNAKEVCVGMLAGILDGDPNGALRPWDNANLAEAAKMVSQAYGISPFQGLVPQPKTAWHERYWFALASRQAIPDTLKARDAKLTRGDFAEIVYRLQGVKPLYGARYVPTFAKDAVEITGAFTLNSDTIAERTTVILVPTNIVAMTERGISIQKNVAVRKLLRMQRVASL